MFCPNCGKPDQAKNSYCRACGQFLPDLNSMARPGFGGHTPQDNARSISFLSLIAGIISVFAGIWMYVTRFNAPVVLYIAAAVLICNALWHFSNMYIARKLSTRIDPQRSSATDASNISGEASDNVPTLDYVPPVNALPAAETNKFITPDSVTEPTTKKLKVK